MAQAIKISASPRLNKGSSDCRRLRRSGSFPGIVYGAGKPQVMVEVNEHEFRKGLHGHSSEHVLLDLDIKGLETKKVILQEVQHNSLTGVITHADFHEVSMTEKLRVEIQVELIGTPVGVTQGGGVLEHLLREVEIECLPGDLMEHVELDVSALNIGENLTVGDIKLDAAKYHIITDPELAVAAVAAPAKEEEVVATPVAVEGAAVAEPEVIKEKKPAAEEKEAADKGKAKEKTK